MRIATARRDSATALAIGLASLSASCGGGGTSPTTPPIPTNHAPGFSSAASASVAENTAGAIYTAVASDIDGDPVTFAITGGPDAAAFTLAGGVLSFVSAPNFDHPTDVSANNLYDVTITASDGKGGATALPLRVQVTNDHEGINLTRVGDFGPDAVIAPLTRKSGLVVVSQDGSVHQIDATSGAVSDTGNVFDSSETGRVLAVAHFNNYGLALLDIAERGVILRSLTLSDWPGHYLEHTLAAPSAVTPRGTLFIGGDGGLYGALGDSSGDLAQDASSGYGKFFRVGIDPYCGASVGAPPCFGAAVYGDGVHAPTGGGGYQHRTFLLDRGTDRQEEIDSFDQSAQQLDFGWPYREGTHERVINPPPVGNGPSLIYGHGSGTFAGTGLTGATVYSGPIASLVGKILLTDESDRIFAFPATFLTDGLLHQSNEMENRTADFAPASGIIRKPAAIVVDHAGRLFVLDGAGALYATG